VVKQTHTTDLVARTHARKQCAKNPHVSTVITGASRAEQVHENFKALDVLPKLTPAVLDEIEKVLRNKPEEYRDFRA